MTTHSLFGQLPRKRLVADLDLVKIEDSAKTTQETGYFQLSPELIENNLRLIISIYWLQGGM